MDQKRHSPAPKWASKMRETEEERLQCGQQSADPLQRIYSPPACSGHWLPEGQVKKTGEGNGMVRKNTQHKEKG